MKVSSWIGFTSPRKQNDVGGPEQHPNLRRGGFSLIEVAAGLALLAVILLGVMAAISTAFTGTRESTDRMENQLLLNRVIEEIQASPYESLLSFNGTFVTEGDHRADIQVALTEPNLIQVQVNVASQGNPGVSSQGVFLLADRE